MLNFSIPDQVSLTAFTLALVYQLIVAHYYNFNRHVGHRLGKWFSQMNLYRVFKVTLFANFFLLALSTYGDSPVTEPFTLRSLFRDPIVISATGIIVYLLLVVVTYGMIYLIWQKNIRKNISNYDYKPSRFFPGLKSYLFASLTMHVWLMFMLFITYRLMHSAHTWFVEHKMTQLDWLKTTTTHNSNDYKKGFYFSVIISAFFALTLIDSLIRLRDQFQKSLTGTRVFVLGSVVFFSMLCGIYSILNTVFHVMNYDNIKDWYKFDKQVGILALRSSSVLLLIHLVNFLFSKVFQQNLILAALASMTRYVSRGRKNVMSDKEYSTMFFAQIGFYILNLTVAEVSLIFQEHALYRTLLDFGLAFIVDDYVIIHSYSSRLEKILRWHYIRIWVFNILLAIGGIATLLSLGLYGYLVLYIATALLLLFVSESNISKVTII